LLSRTYIDSARYGFGSTFWYVWTANGDSKFGIQFTPDTGGEQAAWRTTYDWLVGAQYQRCFTTASDVTVCQFNKGSENFSIVWRGDVGSSNATLPAGYLSGFGSRSCDLNGNCDVMTASTQLTVGPMPVRIDGPPMSSGPSEQPGGDAPDGAVVQPPTILDVTVVYGPSNKANAFASWTPPSNLIDVRVNGYDYEWRFCSGSSCRQVARGSTGPDTLSASTDLPNGPGRYEFAVRARASFYVKTEADPSTWTVSGSGTSSFAVSRFNQLTSRAAAPSNVFFAARERSVGGVKDAEVVWAKPAIQAGQDPRYEVQARNLTANGKWKTFRLTKENRLNFPADDINLEFGQVGQARVRTVLANGQTSAFIASNEFTLTQAEPRPNVVTVFNAPNSSLYMYVVSGSGSKAKYPSQGFQVRASSDGVNWTMMKYLGSNGVGDAPNAAPNNMIPFDQNVFVGRFPPGEFDRAQIRTVFSDGRLPSNWVQFVG
jgi:hypothetical protein